MVLFTLQGLYTTINYGIIMIFYINLIVREMCSKQTKWQEGSICCLNDSLWLSILIF